jgi:hypothetical protein
MYLLFPHRLTTLLEQFITVYKQNGIQALYTLIFVHTLLIIKNKVQAVAVYATQAFVNKQYQNTSHC